MIIRFWGVRGSIPSPGPETAEVGGNTSCVEIECGSTRIILDAGTGIRGLGARLVERHELDVHLFLSHYHWDHIQGLPYFAPAYVPSANLKIFGPATTASLREVLCQQMAWPSFPVAFDELESSYTLRQVEDRDRLWVDGVLVSASIFEHHPGGVAVYRIEHDGRSVVYATDMGGGSSPDPALLALADEADLLIYDAQYTPAEYPGKSGGPKMAWGGHSTYEMGCAIAHAAKVGRLVLFHHDPRRTDREVAELEAQAQLSFDGATAAREGAVIQLDSIAPVDAESLGGHVRLGIPSRCNGVQSGAAYAAFRCGGPIARVRPGDPSFPRAKRRLQRKEH